MKHLVYFDANEYKFLLTGIDTRSEACQRFFREGLTISFTKILTDEAVNSWKFEIHVSTVRKNKEHPSTPVIIALHSRQTFGGGDGSRSNMHDECLSSEMKLCVFAESEIHEKRDVKRLLDQMCRNKVFSSILFVHLLFFFSEMYPQEL